jgi:hypothetical protein
MDLSKDILAPIIAAVFASVVLAVLGWGWLKLAPRGQRFWDTLGTFQGPATRTASFKVEGIRTLFIVAALGLVVALAALTTTLFKQSRAGPAGPSGQPGSMVTNLAAERIGPNGIEGQVTDPGIFSGVDFRIIPQAEGAPFCTLSDINVNQSPGNCDLHRDGNGWSISAMAGMQCRVTCFRLSAK